MSDELNSWTWYDLLHFWIGYDNDSRKNIDTFLFFYNALSNPHKEAVSHNVTWDSHWCERWNISKKEEQINKDKAPICAFAHHQTTNFKQILFHLHFRVFLDVFWGADSTNESKIFVMSKVWPQFLIL